MTRVGPDVPKLEAVDRSGFPFQLAVERELRRLGPTFSWDVTATEVPVGEDFADIVVSKWNMLAVIECKRVDEGEWHFLVPRGTSSNVARCRLEWHNPRATTTPSFLPRTLSKVFCSDFTMCEGSYESSIAILPKKHTAHSLEILARTVLEQANELGRSL